MIDSQVRDETISSIAAPPLIVIKIGGCLITDKKTFKSTDLSRIKAIGKEIGGLLNVGALRPNDTVIILGGGSFGNAIPPKYKLHPKTSQTRQEDISRMSLGQIELARVVMDLWREIGIPMQFFHLPSLITGIHAIESFDYTANMFPLTISLKAGLIPILMGDLISTLDGETSIISSDIVPNIIANSLNVRKMVFLTDVRGVLEKKDDGAATISEILLADIDEIEQRIWSAGQYDFTGGMAIKLRLCAALAKRGTPSFIIDGRTPGSLEQLFVNGSVCGTVVKPDKILEKWT